MRVWVAQTEKCVKTIRKNWHKYTKTSSEVDRETAKRKEQSMN